MSPGIVILNCFAGVGGLDNKKALVTQPLNAKDPKDPMSVVGV